jgi:small subunit ribosomal protein S5
MDWNSNMPHMTSSAPVQREFDEKIVQVNRVSKKTKGGNKIGFSVLVVVGDKMGKVGVGLGKGPDVSSSIQKATRRAKKFMIKVPIVNDTIPFPVQIKRGAAVILLKPAKKGTGVIAGGAVRAVVEAAGVKNIVSKIMGSSNQASNVYATFKALEEIQKLAQIKGIKLVDQPVPVTIIKSNPRPPMNKPKFQPRPNRPQANKPAAKPAPVKTTK